MQAQREFAFPDGLKPALFPLATECANHYYGTCQTCLNQEITLVEPVS